MIWMHKSASQIERPCREELPNAFYWLLLQTFIFGAIAFVLFTLVPHTGMNDWWLAPLSAVALLGFVGGILGVFAVLGVVYARDITNQ